MLTAESSSHKEKYAGGRREKGGTGLAFNKDEARGWNGGRGVRRSIMNYGAADRLRTGQVTCYGCE